MEKVICLFYLWIRFSRRTWFRIVIIKTACMSFIHFLNCSCKLVNNLINAFNVNGMVPPSIGCKEILNTCFHLCSYVGCIWSYDAQVRSATLLSQVLWSQLHYLSCILRRSRLTSQLLRTSPYYHTAIRYNNNPHDNTRTFSVISTLVAICVIFPNWKWSVKKEYFKVKTKYLQWLK